MGVEKPLPSLFDAHLHPAGLADQDLESLRFFGVTGALVAADDSPAKDKPKALLAHFENLLEVQLPRLQRAGIRGFAALGVHPRALPRRGLPEVLSALPSFFRGGKVVALGAIGLSDGTEAEEEAFLEQLALARRLQLPVLVHTPPKEKERITRRTLTLLQKSGVRPERVLVDHAAPRTVRLILACGHHAGLTLHPDQLTVEKALALVKQLGPKRLVLDSDAGEGATDLLGLPRMASRLAKAKLPPLVLRRVGRLNAMELLKISADL